MGLFGIALNGVDDLLLALPLIGAYIMFALGIVVIFRASRVLNLAHGAMATLPAYVYYQLSTVWHWPAWPALAVAILAGAATGLLVERAFVRPLRRVSSTAQTVGTVAAFGLIVAFVAKVWGTLAVRSVPLFGHGYLVVAGAELTAGKLGLFAVGIVVAGVFYAFFRFTRIGLAMRGAADNRRAAALMGVDPERTTAVAWALGGGTAALAGILLGAATSMEPYTLSLQALPGFVTVLIGGMESLLGAVWGGAVVGAAIGLVPIVPGLGAQQGAPQLMLMLLAFVVMAARGARFSTSDVRGDALGTGLEAAAGGRRDRVLRKDLAALGIALTLAFPHLPGVTSNLVGDANTALEYGVVALSLVLLIGLVGQISLAQGSFVGIGAFVTGVLVARYHVPFPAGMPIAAVVGGAAATALGLVALRVRGLYLAVATLIFAWMCDSYLFQQDWLVGVGGSTSFDLPALGVSPGYPFFDFSNRTTFYYAALATAAIVAMVIWLLRRSKTGRAFFAIRGSEMAAASLGIDIVRYKLLAFAVAGVVASAAGSLFAADARAITPAEFNVTVSLFYLSVAVVGGLTSIGGAIAAAVLFAVLKEVFFQVDALNGYLDVVSSGLLIAVLLAYPGGLAAVPKTVARWLRRSGLEAALGRAADGAGALAGRLDALYERIAAQRRRQAPDASRMRLAELLSADGHAPAAEPVAANGSAPQSTLAVLAARSTGPALPAAREQRKVVLAGEHLTMRFGGLVAVDDVSLDVREGEVVGLIGPNGAGKTTCFNCISGLLVPSSGRVELFGRDVTRRPVHERAALGLGRTFQVIQLFPQLNVFENLLVATHSSNSTGVLSQVAVTRRAVLAERDARAWVWQVIRLLDLEEVASRPISGLPFGQLRIVEVARALVTGARLLMLDEPASGLDNAETDRLADLLMTLRSLLGLTILIIEHDVRMVTSVSDYMYVLDRGRLLAEGPPAAVQQDAAVIAAYLGQPVSAGAAGPGLTVAQS